MDLIIYYIFTLCAFSEAVKFYVTNSTQEITLDEGEQSVEFEISGVPTDVSNTDCNKGKCRINDKIILNTTSCLAKAGSDTNSKNITANLVISKVTESYKSTWECIFVLLTDKGAKNITRLIKANVRKKEKPEELPNKWIYIGGSLGLVVLLIIIGQTVCIIYFKAKARKALIDKNLTPRNSSADDLAGRYESRPSKKNTPEQVRESQIYEALDNVKGMPPVPPPLSTLPRTPKRGHLARSASQSTLAMRPEYDQGSINMRIKGHNNKKFNTFDRCSSLERPIKNRPQFPLPTEGIYEVVMAQGDSGPSSSRSRINLALQNSPLMDNRHFGRPADPRLAMKLPPPEHHRSNPAFHTKPNQLSPPNNQWQPPDEKMPSPKAQWQPPKVKIPSPTNQWQPPNQMPSLINQLRQPKEKMPSPTNPTPPLLKELRQRMPNKLQTPDQRMANPTNNWQPPNQRMPTPNNDWQPPNHRMVTPTNDRQPPNQRMPTPNNDWQPPNQRMLTPVNDRLPPNQRMASPTNDWQPTNQMPPSAGHWQPPTSPTNKQWPGRNQRDEIPPRTPPVRATPPPIRKPAAAIVPSGRAFEPGSKPPMGIPMLPSMISPANLRPVRPMAPSSGEARMAPVAPSLANRFRPPPLPSKPKTPMPSLPTPTQSQSPPMPESYYGSDDDEEWTYEPLPNYNYSLYNI